MNRWHGLYGITDDTLTPDETIVTQVTQALQAGVGIVQFRTKRNDSRQAYMIAKKLREVTFEHRALFVINDDPILAHTVSADGLHIGGDDMTFSQAREHFPKGVIGVSCYGSVQRAIRAYEEGAGYIALGSFFPSATKPQSAIVPFNVMKEVREHVPLPLCVIGGIQSHNIAQFAPYHPEMVACVQAIFDGDITLNVHNLLGKTQN